MLPVHQHAHAVLPVRRTKGFGWKPDLPDQRDLMYAAPLTVARHLPTNVDLRQTHYSPPVYDQGNLGSCTANGIAGLHAFVQAKEGQHQFQPSRLFIYYFERVMEGTVNDDSGAYIRDGMKVISKLGVPPEPLCPYDISRFTNKPSDAAIAEASKYQALVYRRLIGSNAHSLKTCLASVQPITFGFTVYESFESSEVATTGKVPLPGPREQILGGHCVDLWGYDDAQSAFLVRNSWGEGWGLGGYCWMPYAYVQNPGLCSDFWTLTKTEATQPAVVATPSIERTAVLGSAVA